MKKIILFAILLGSSYIAQAQTASQLFNNANAARMQNVEKVKIGGFLMSLGKALGGVSNVPVVEGIKSLEILSMESCNRDEMSNLLEKINNLQDGGGYETLIIASEQNESLRIVTKKKRGVIEELILFCMDESDSAIIKFKGKIKESDIIKLIQQNTKK